VESRLIYTFFLLKKNNFFCENEKFFSLFEKEGCKYLSQENHTHGKKAKSLKLDLNRFFVVIFFFHFFWYVLYIKKNFFLQNVISKDLWRNHRIFILGRMMICGRGKNCFLFSRKNGIRSFKLGTHFLNN
jgi:hypothetical protein